MEKMREKSKKWSQKEQRTKERKKYKETVGKKIKKFSTKGERKQK